MNDSGNVTRVEFNSICRLCIQLLGADKVSPIFNNDVYAERVTLPERIWYCSSVEVCEGDGLPNNICSSCLLKLNQSFVFRNQCVLADNTLKLLIQDVRLNMKEVHLVNVDMENQVIHSETRVPLVNATDATAHNAVKEEDDTVKKRPESEKNSDDGSIDEFDNSKNGRHKRNISRLNDRSKMCENGVESDKESEDDESGDVPKGNRRRGRRKRQAKVEMKPEIKQEDGGHVEDVTVEPDVFSLGDGNKDGERKKVLKRGRPRKSSVAREKPSSFTCEHCQKVYPSEGGWRYHIHTIHNENFQPFLCDLCGKAFKVKKNLESHKNSIHYRLKHHLCDLCGRGFATKYALKVHKIWHSDEKNYPCDICGTKFRTRGKLNTHRSIHGGPKKFMCHVCSRDFRWKKDFDIHMRTHTGERPFKCSRCGWAFTSLTNMKKHERRHASKDAGRNDGEDGEDAVGQSGGGGGKEREGGGEGSGGQGTDIRDRNIIVKSEMVFEYGCTS